MDLGAEEGPEVAGICFSCPFSGRTEGGTRVPATEDVHQPVKRFSREASQIAPDWSRGKVSRLNLCSQVLDGEGFDLSISEDAARSAKSSLDANFETGVSSAKADKSGAGRIHTPSPPQTMRLSLRERGCQKS